MGVSGGGILVLIAVLLWAAVLVPRLIRGHQHRARLRQSRKLQRTMQRLAHVAQETAADRLIYSAREALNREKLQELKLQREAAQREAQLAHARAERELAKLAAKQAAKLARAQMRAAKLVSPAMQRLRRVLAVITVLAVVAVTVSGGYAIATGHTTLFFAALTTMFSAAAGLLLCAPGRNLHARELLQQQRVAAQREAQQRGQQQPVPAAVSQQTQEQPKQAAVVDHAAQVAAQRRVNAERQARRKLLAQVRQSTAAQQQAVATGEGLTLENQTQSILLRRAAVKQPDSVPQSAPQPVAVEQQVPRPVPQPTPQLALQPVRQPVAVPRPESNSQRGAQWTAASPQRAEKAALTPEQLERQQLVTRLRRMGDLQDLQVTAVDLDAALRNRRSANS